MPSEHLRTFAATGSLAPAGLKLFDRNIGHETRGKAAEGWPAGRGFYATTKAYGAATKRAELPLWVTETGGLYGSGGRNVTDSFASAFWYLDELGATAKKSVAVHCRQALVGGHYGLLRRVGDALRPRPDFFATRLWAALMGAAVLDAVLTTDDADDRRDALDVRAYAHCRLGERDDLVLALVNSATRRARMVLLPDSLQGLDRLEFHATAPLRAGDARPDLFGKTVLLNDVPLRAPDQPLVPISARGDLVLAPASYAFVVFQGARWPSC